MIKKEAPESRPDKKQNHLAKWIVIWIMIVVVAASGVAIGANWWMQKSDAMETVSHVADRNQTEEQTPQSESKEQSEWVNVETEAVLYQPAVPVQELPVLYQKPELPAGCEATAIAMLLQGYGYDLSKEKVAEALPKSTFEVKDGRTYAAHPNEAYVGDPFSTSGFGVFAKAAAETAQALIDAAGGQHRALDCSGAAEETLLQYLDSGVPVCIWATMGMSGLVYSGEWYLKDGETYTDERYIWPGGEHCLVLVGYNESVVTVHDPLSGVRTYDRVLFFQRYQEVGQYAMILEAPAEQEAPAMQEVPPKTAE